MIEVLSWLNSEFEKARVPYELLEWTQTMTYPYFVGEYSEFEPNSEDGQQDATFILTGFCRGKNARLKLLEMREKIKKRFPPVGGKTAIFESKSAIAVFYSNSFFIPSGEDELYKIQINLTLKTWKVG